MLWGKLLNMFLLNFLFFFWQITKPPAGDFSEKYFSAVDGGEKMVIASNSIKTSNLSLITVICAEQIPE